MVSNENIEIHAAAKETVALAEERFMSNSHNWPFDNAWQEVLNHATNKVSVKQLILQKNHSNQGNLFHFCIS